MRFHQFNKPLLLEADSRIQHAEDIIFFEGSAGAMRVLNSLRNLEKGGYSDVTVKWDGSPAIIFGRNQKGEFILTDKGGFVAKGYDGKATSAEALEAMLKARPGYAKNPKGYGPFVANMKNVFAMYEKTVPNSYVGFFKGDLLYFNTPKIEEGSYVFKPQIVTYSVDTNSELGKKISASKTGVVVHSQVGIDGIETKPTDTDNFIGDEVLVFPPVTVEKAPQVPNAPLDNAERIIKKDAQAIDSLLNKSTLGSLQITDFANILYAYTNSKVDTGLSNLGGDFAQWLETTPRVSNNKKVKIAQYIQDNAQGFSSLWEVVNTIMKVKDQVIQDMDNQSSTVKQSINGNTGGEGYVLASPKGAIKLVPRATFSAANRAVQR